MSGEGSVKALHWLRAHPRITLMIGILAVVVPFLVIQSRLPTRRAARAALAAARAHPAIIARLGENARPSFRVGVKVKGKKAEVVLTLRGEEQEMMVLVELHQDVNGWWADHIDRVDRGMIEPLGPGPPGGLPYR